MTVLEQDIIRYNLLYRAGVPEISDSVYDNMLDTYQSMLSESEYKTFRERLFEKPGKSKHPYIMGSLDKTKADDDSLIKWITKYNVKTLFVSSKIDGLSVRLYYINGVLTDAVTRGDGEYGESIYNKAIFFVPTKINDSFTGHIRGEIVLTKDNFIKLCEIDNKEYKNPRNAAVGLINSKEFKVESVKLLNVITYEIIGENSTKINQFTTLISLGFNVAKYVSTFNVNVDTIKEDLLELFNDILNLCNYDIDGLVITSSDNNVFENEYIPKNIIAFKTNLNIGETTIIDIEWNISKSGYFKPVCIFDPIKLGGAMVSRASMYNYQWVKDRNICYGDKIKVLLSGEIIPKVIEIISSNAALNNKVFIPETCEYCDTILTIDGVELKCPNINCSEPTLLKVSQFIRRLGIDDASTKTLRNLHILSFNDLINWRPDESYKSQIKLYNEFITKIFSIKREKLFAALDCDGLGEKTVNKFINSIGLNNLLSRTFIPSNLLGEGIGEKTVTSFLSTLDNNIAIYNMFILDERYNVPDVIQQPACITGILNGKSYCFTGKLNTMSRSEAEEMVTNAGGKIAGVSKNLTYLVTNDKDSGSAKNKKAQALGITLIDEKEFLSQIKNEESDISSI